MKVNPSILMDTILLNNNAHSRMICIFLFSSFLLMGQCDARTLETQTECLVCGRIHENGDHMVEYKGMDIPLCSAGCFEHYNEAVLNGKLDPITAKIEPRAALFQEDSNQKDPLTKSFFWLGYYVLLGLVFGGLASYLAVQRGSNPWSGFLLGFFLNVVGFILVRLKPKRKIPFYSEGLTKVPTTRSEIICPKCGHSNHPSAKKCIECDQKMKSPIRSEVQSVGLAKRV